ncbi:hypothetical protein HYALB_00003379 [Hymenoscyphus albidus]|uniref:2EXR domain-containing protein n=1 Tax=Hymenoscyphus albidus TaxID=595503 RepID=A0A9N9PW48_9HELO|nr:hypothetical protein HYALB_00003379 [Hymenoscyphus albidus]
MDGNVFRFKAYAGTSTRKYSYCSSDQDVTARVVSRCFRPVEGDDPESGGSGALQLPHYQHLPTSTNICQHLPTSTNICQHLPTSTSSLGILSTMMRHATNPLQTSPSSGTLVDATTSLKVQEAPAEWCEVHQLQNPAHPVRLSQNGGSNSILPRITRWYFIAITLTCDSDADSVGGNFPICCSAVPLPVLSSLHQPVPDEYISHEDKRLASVTGTKNLPEVHPFSRLPLEIQDHIWIAAFGPPTRLIEMQGNFRDGRNIAAISKLSTSNLERGANANRYPFFDGSRYRVLGYYTHSFCPLPVLLHVSSRSRQIVLENYETCFTNNLNPDMRPFHEAVYAFGLEWAGYADRIGVEFLKSEKALFEEAAASLPPSVREQETIFRFQERLASTNKVVLRKGKTRPFGIWFRPTWDTIILREEDIDQNAIEVVGAFKDGESNAHNVRSFVLAEQIIRNHPRVWDTLSGRRRPRRITSEFDTADEDHELLDDNHESNADIAKPLLTGLDELIVLVNRGFYHHYMDGKRIDHTHEEVNDLKQKMHDRILLRMKHRSALTEIPKISNEREDRMYGWTRWEEPLGPPGRNSRDEKRAQFSAKFL